MKLKKDNSRNMQINVMNAGIRQFEKATSVFEIDQTNLYHKKGSNSLMETGQCAWLFLRAATTAKKLSAKNAVVKIEVKLRPTTKKN